MLYGNSIKLPNARVATGLYSHIDSVIKVDREVLGWIRMSKPKAIKSGTLGSIGEVICALKESIETIDDERLISESVFKSLRAQFPRREVRTGGNGNNMGKALLELGLVPLVSYPCRPEKLMRISGKFKVACGRKLEHPMNAIRNKDPEYEHLIFESQEWRDIFTWDLTTSRGMFDDDFLRLAFDPMITDVAIISYAHLLSPRYRKRTDHVLDFIKNKRPKVHLEFGLGSEQSMRYAMSKFSEGGFCDSWGFNERECMLYLRASSAESDDLEEACLRAIKEYNLSRICVHSSKYAFSISRYDSKKEINALIEGCKAAGIQASGKIGYNSKISPLIKRIGNYNLCMVPTFYNAFPKKITGLGDAFAAVQAVVSLC
jgi:ADP-dependent phosphofructokinase/glucokinase